MVLCSAHAKNKTCFEFGNKTLVFNEHRTGVHLNYNDGNLEIPLAVYVANS